ncbi:MAG: GNAT family N-acetyltransferase [Treponema sp.]|nr:GNAT family N-acetyltransferase [Treponema sp.]
MAGPGDEAVLRPLHFAYVREEVLLSGGTLNEGFERRQLREALEKQVVVMAVREQSGPREPDKACIHAVTASVQAQTLEKSFAAGVPDDTFEMPGCGRPLAKAGTNAIASKVMQLGGVYTLRDERGRGLAAALTAFLAESAARKGFATVLFVNKKNAAAIAAYRRAGFTDSGKAYTIEYYGS